MAKKGISTTYYNQAAQLLYIIFCPSTLDCCAAAIVIKTQIRVGKKKTFYEMVSSPQGKIFMDFQVIFFFWYSFFQKNEK